MPIEKPLTDCILLQFVPFSMAPKKKQARKKAPSKKQVTENPTNPINPTENEISGREPDRIILESRGGKPFEAITENKAIVPFREFPNVSRFQESGLLLFRAGKYRTNIGPLIGRGRDWFAYQYKYHEEFRKYTDQIELQLLAEIRENAVPVAVGMFRILEQIAIGDYDWEDKIQAGKLAFAYLEKTGRLPKSDDKEEEDKKIEQAVQALATSLTEQFGDRFSV